MSATQLISMPPEPVTGLCCFPVPPQSSGMIFLIPSTSPPASRDICRKLAASIFSVSAAMRISLSQMVGELSSFQAGWGRESAGSVLLWLP